MDVIRVEKLEIAVLPAEAAEKLSLPALGLLAWAAARNVRQLWGLPAAARKLGVAESRLSAILQELATAGYARLVPVRGAGGKFIGRCWTITVFPNLETEAKLEPPPTEGPKSPASAKGPESSTSAEDSESSTPESSTSAEDSESSTPESSTSAEDSESSTSAENHSATSAESQASPASEEAAPRERADGEAAEEEHLTETVEASVSAKAPSSSPLFSPHPYSPPIISPVFAVGARFSYENRAERKEKSFFFQLTGEKRKELKLTSEQAINIIAHRANQAKDRALTHLTVREENVVCALAEMQFAQEATMSARSENAGDPLFPELVPKKRKKQSWRSKDVKTWTTADFVAYLLARCAQEGKELLTPKSAIGAHLKTVLHWAERRFASDGKLAVKELIDRCVANPRMSGTGFLLREAETFFERWAPPPPEDFVW